MDGELMKVLLAGVREVPAVEYLYECPLPECAKFGYARKREEAVGALARHMKLAHPEMLESE